MVKLTNFDHLTTEIPQFWPWSWSEKTNFDHLTTAISKFWPWSWSKIFDHLTMTPGRGPNGQKFMVILPPPPPPKLTFYPAAPYKELFQDSQSAWRRQLLLPRVRLHTFRHMQERRRSKGKVCPCSIPSQLV